MKINSFHLWGPICRHTQWDTAELQAAFITEDWNWHSVATQRNSFTNQPTSEQQVHPTRLFHHQQCPPPTRPPVITLAPEAAAFLPYSPQPTSERDDDCSPRIGWVVGAQTGCQDSNCVFVWKEDRILLLIISHVKKKEQINSNNNNENHNRKWSTQSSLNQLTVDLSRKWVRHLLFQDREIILLS